MYERFYGLTRTPFAVTPDPAMLFMSQVHREALATIIYGVETRKGFIVCTGEVGTGKSTIIRAFFDQVLADAVKLIYIFTPQVSPLEMAQYICREMELAPPDSVFAAVPQLQMKLLELFEAGQTVVLMIDEAQLLPPETLEFLRLLSNFETDTEKLIQIVLVGQPEVDTILARRDMRQVNQRVALRARLAPLSAQETYEYIDHRIRVSGAAELAQVMSPSAAWLIAEAAGGIPRVINILADNALIAGFGAAQRPLGSQLAGNTVRDFLAKSGPARPVAPQRLASGWRAAMRLRGALARERDEPEEFVPASPTAQPPFEMRPIPLVIPPQAAATALRPSRSPGVEAHSDFGVPIDAQDVQWIEPEFELPDLVGYAPVVEPSRHSASPPAPSPVAAASVMPAQRALPHVTPPASPPASWPVPAAEPPPDMPSPAAPVAVWTPTGPIRSGLPPRRP